MSRRGSRAVRDGHSISPRLRRRGTTLADLEDPNQRYIEAHNKKAKPFVWTASAVSIFEKLAEIPEPSE